MADWLMGLATCYLLVYLLFCVFGRTLMGWRVLLVGLAWPYEVAMGLWDAVDWYALVWKRRDE